MLADTQMKDETLAFVPPPPISKALRDAEEKLTKFRAWMKLADECLEAREKGDVSEWRPKSIGKRRHEDWIKPLADEDLSEPSSKRRKVAANGIEPWAASAEQNRALYSGRHFADNMYDDAHRARESQTESLKSNSFSVPDDDSEDEGDVTPENGPARSIAETGIAASNAASTQPTSTIVQSTMPAAANANSEALARERQKAEKYKPKTPTRLHSVSRLSSSPLSSGPNDSNKENTAPVALGAVPASAGPNEFDNYAWPHCRTYVESSICDEKIQQLLDERWTTEHQEAGFEHFQRGFQAYKAAEAQAKAMGVRLEVMVD